MVSTKYNPTQTTEIFSYSGFSVLMVSRSELAGQSALRHDIYVQENKWVNESSPREELDQWDSIAKHVEVRTPDGTTIASLRTVASCHPWLIETAFLPTIPNVDVSSLKKEDANEASRLAVDQAWRRKRLGDRFTAVELLLAGVYFMNTELDVVEDTYLTTEPFTSRLLSHAGMIQEQIGCPTKMPDGCVISTYRTSMSKLTNAPFVKMLKSKLSIESAILV